MIGPCNNAFGYDPEFDNSDNVVVVMGTFNKYPHYEELKRYTNIIHITPFQHKNIAYTSAKRVVPSFWVPDTIKELRELHSKYGYGIFNDNNTKYAREFNDTYKNVSFYPKHWYLGLLNLGYSKTRLRPTTGITSLWYVLNSNPKSIHMYGLSYWTDVYSDTYLEERNGKKVPSKGSRHDIKLEQQVFKFIYNTSKIPIHIYNSNLSAFVMS